VLSVKQDEGGLAGDKNKNTGAFGIFDKIYNYLNRQSKEEKEELEQKQRESDRRLLLGGGSHGFGLKKNLQSTEGNINLGNSAFSNYAKMKYPNT